MRNTRKFQETLLSKWDGYPKEHLQIKIMLKRAMG
jgi:hypothetical protein